jgi:nitrogen fixation protein NifQ
MAHALGDENDHVIACMLASWQTGVGAMPDRLGLEPQAFRTLLRERFPGFDSARLIDTGLMPPADRKDEFEELLQLLLRNRAPGSPRMATWICMIVATGCLAADHLWQDLGLWSRADLSALMRRNVPALAARNVNDMKWKRFLYKQLCEAEGIYTCRAPSCAQCVDYAECFGNAD